MSRNSVRIIFAYKDGSVDFDGLMDQRSTFYTNSAAALDMAHADVTDQNTDGL
jgi:hypothetical protein